MILFSDHFPDSDVEAEIRLPKNALPDPRVDMVFFLMNGGDLKDILDPEDTNLSLNSHVISASIQKGRHVEISSPVRMVFRNRYPASGSRPRCVFWDYESR